MNFQLYKLVTKFVFRQSPDGHVHRERAFLNPVARWHCKNLPYPKQVDVSYKRLYWLQMPVQQIKRLLLQPFRVATVTIMEHSAILATTVTRTTTIRQILIVYVPFGHFYHLTIYQLWILIANASFGGINLRG